MTLKVFKGGRQICIHNGAYVLHFQEITSLFNLANSIIPLTANPFEFGQFHHTFNGLHGHFSMSKILGDLSSDSMWRIHHKYE